MKGPQLIYYQFALWLNAQVANVKQPTYQVFEVIWYSVDRRLASRFDTTSPLNLLDFQKTRERSFWSFVLPRKARTKGEVVDLKSKGRVHRSGPRRWSARLQLSTRSK